jgi:uncharacterized protein YhaN
MNKEAEDKLANAIIALHQEIKGMRNEFTQEITGLRKDMERHQAQTNRGLGEMRLSYMKLDESFNKYASSNDKIVRGHETRITRLEEKTPGGSYPPAGRAGAAREPAVKYKRKKKK